MQNRCSPNDWSHNTWAQNPGVKLQHRRNIQRREIYTRGLANVNLMDPQFTDANLLNLQNVNQCLRHVIQLCICLETCSYIEPLVVMVNIRCTF